MRLKLLLVTGWLLLFVPEILRAYFVLPLPGSQLNDTVAIAYFLHRYINIFRIAGGILVVYSLYRLLIPSSTARKLLNMIPVVLYGIILYLTSVVMKPDKMFLQLKEKKFADVASNVANKNTLVIGVEINSEAKAYPLKQIGYHHQVEDTIGGTPVIVTYCTACRSGRAYSPIIEGEYHHFRLVGMERFNAVFEDEATKSWWRQENGEAISGPMKGKWLDEVPSQQMTLEAWVSKHPQTQILQPDPSFTKNYEALSRFDEGSIQNDLEGTNRNSWQLKSWVIGIKMGDAERAYDWNDLKKNKVINDTLGTAPLVIMLENDGLSFHTFNRAVNDSVLHFVWNDGLKKITDRNTQSTWNFKGICIDGPLKGMRLTPIQSYQEFWHSWKEFHPKTTLYKMSGPGA